MVKKTFIYILAVLSFLALPLLSSAIGQITEPIVITDALRGQSIPQKMTLINSEEVNIVFQVKADGEIKDWITFYNRDNMQDPITEVEIAPVFYHDVYAVIKVPADVPNGVYEGSLDAIVSPEKNQSDNLVSINMKVSRSVSITVSDKEVVDIETSIIPVSYLLNSGEPAQIRIIYTNKGNITVKPDVQLKIFDSDNKLIFNAIFPYPADQLPVNSAEQKEIPAIEWQTTGQAPGDYIAEVTILANGQTFKTEQATFTLKPAGFAAVSDIANLKSSDIIIISLLGIVIIAIAIKFVFKKKKSVQL